MLTRKESSALGLGAVLIATVHAVDHAVLDGPGVVIHAARVRGINTLTARLAATTGIGIVAGATPEAAATVDTLVRTHISCAAIIAPVPVRLIVGHASVAIGEGVDYPRPYPYITHPQLIHI